MNDLNSTASVTEAPILPEAHAANSDDWDIGPPRRPVDSLPGVPAVNSLSPEEMTNVHIDMLNELIGPTHKMAVEYLHVSGGLTADNPGRERKVNMSCKLVALTTKVILAVEKLTSDAG